MTKIEVFKKIFELHSKAEEYYETVPSDLSSIFFENEYSNNREMIVEVLMRAYFTETENASIGWFLYDWYSDRELFAVVDGQEYKFETIDDYIAYLTEYEGWKTS